MHFNDRRGGADRRSNDRKPSSAEPPYLTKDGLVLNDRRHMDRRLEEALKYGVVEEIEIEPLH